MMTPISTACAQVPWLAWRLAVVLTAVASATANADDEDRERLRARLLEQMRGLASQSVVEFVDDRAGGQPQFVDKPVFRYDDQPRRFIDATVWVWTHAGRPVAFQKIEARENVDTGAPQWGFCFTSLASQRIRVAWPVDRVYQSREPGIRFLPLPDAPAVATLNSARRRQLRELARNFTARILTNPDTGNSQQMRLLTTPLLEYDEQGTKAPQGAVFAFSTNGTNPDLILILEAQPTAGGLGWHYAAARMTSGGLTVKHLDRTIWEVPFISHYNPLPTWAFFDAPREPVESN